MFTKDEISILTAALQTYDDFIQREQGTEKLQQHIKQLKPKVENFCSMTHLTQTDLTTLLYSVKYVIDVSEDVGTYISEEPYRLFDKIYNLLDS